MRPVDKVFLAIVFASVLTAREKSASKTGQTTATRVSGVSTSTSDTTSRAAVVEGLIQTNVSAAEALALNEDTS